MVLSFSDIPKPDNWFLSEKSKHIRRLWLTVKQLRKPIKPPVHKKELANYKFDRYKI